MTCFNMTGGSQLTGAPPAQTAERQFRRLLVIGRQHATRAGLNYDDAEDCAITFVERMLLSDERNVVGPLSQGRTAWLLTCARNHASNYRRGLKRHGSLVRNASRAGREQVSVSSAGLEPTPERSLMLSLSCQQVSGAVDRLTPSARSLFIQHYVDGVPINALALSCGRSVHATGEALRRARRAVARALEREGSTIEDLLGP